MKIKNGSLLIDIAGYELTTEDKEILTHPTVGGIVLFSRNFYDIKQIKNLTHSIKKLKSPEILIAIDHEGGLVQRIKEPLTILPSASSFGKLYDFNPRQALENCFNTGFTMASELLELGVDLSFAPVIDMYNQQSQVISTRAFHHHPQIITKLARQFILGMNKAGMYAVGKHFPGHGSVTQDSHLELPRSNLTLPELESSHLQPFINLANNLGAVMTAHINFPHIDQELVTFSQYWLEDLLRKKYNFKGYIFSDCLNMQGAVVKYPAPQERVTRALNAGVDFVLMCNDRSSVLEII